MYLLSEPFRAATACLHIVAAVLNGSNGEEEGPLTQHIVVPAILVPFLPRPATFLQVPISSEAYIYYCKDSWDVGTYTVAGF